MRLKYNIFIFVFISIFCIANGQAKQPLKSDTKDSLKLQLSIILEDDQKYRELVEDLKKKNPVLDTIEMKSLFTKMKIVDSFNLIKVKGILDKYGWLDSTINGGEGTEALFLVIQHADLLTQKKYLPSLKEAVIQKKVTPKCLAYLEDRVALGSGNKQSYGTQLCWDYKINKYYVQPLEDPKNVDKRRALIGLGSLSSYLKYFGINWSEQQYQKDLPIVDSIMKLQ